MSVFESESEAVDAEDFPTTLVLACFNPCDCDSTSRVATLLFTESNTVTSKVYIAGINHKGFFTVCLDQLETYPVFTSQTTYEILIHYIIIIYVLALGCRNTYLFNIYTIF